MYFYFILLFFSLLRLPQHLACFLREMMDDPVTLFQARALAWLFGGTCCGFGSIIIITIFTIF